VSVDGAAPSRGTDVEVVPLRDIRAVVRQAPFRRVDATSDAIARHRQVVESLQQARSIVPAPFGTVFRSRDALLRWMELHYVVLSEAVEFVRDRAAARIRMTPLNDVSLAAFESAVFDSLGFLRRSAVASVTPDADFATRSAEASFLVERVKWDAFTNALVEEKERLPDLAIETTGPWPPYDFVRLQFDA
jgi:hypothetical protein